MKFFVVTEPTPVTKVPSQVLWWMGYIKGGESLLWSQMLSENILWLGLVESKLIHHERRHPNNHKDVRSDIGQSVD